jgi:spermidine synthase
VQDARVFVRRQLARGHRYDYILLDAFTGEYIPEHLMTKEFLTEIKRLLTKDGVVVANTFSSSRLYHHESATYADVFGELYTMRLPTSGNRIILGARSGNLPTKDILEQRANTLGSALTPFGVALAAFPKYITDRVDWDSGAAVLTDQYAPANLLNRP